MILEPQGVFRSFISRARSSRFVRDVSVLTVANIACAGLGFAQGIFVARSLGPELYGIATLLVAVPTLIYSFFDARSTSASVKYLSQFHARGEKERAAGMCRISYTVDVSIAAVAWFAVMASSGWAARNVIHQADLSWLIGVYSLAFLPHALRGTSFAVLSTLGRFSILAWINAATEALRAVLVLGLVLLGWSVTGVVVGNAVAMAVSGLVSGIIAYSFIVRIWHKSPLVSSWRALRGYRREIFKFLAFNDLSFLLAMIPKQLDVLILGYMRGPVDAGYYRLAKSLASLAGFVIDPLRWVALPRLARVWGQHDNSPGAMRREVSRLAFRVGAPLGALIAVGLLVVKPALGIFVGQDYLPAVVAAKLLLGAAVVWAVFFWLRPLYLAVGRPDFWAVGIGIHSLCFGVLAVPAISFGGYAGMAAIRALLDATFHLGMLGWSRRIVRR